MRNVNLSLEDGHLLHIVIDLDVPGAVTRSGKSESVASSEGNITLLDGKGGYRAEVMNINIYRPLSRCGMGTDMPDGCGRDDEGEKG